MHSWTTYAKAGPVLGEPPVAGVTYVNHV